jgi:hypothetical protein
VTPKQDRFSAKDRSATVDRRVVTISRVIPAEQIPDELEDYHPDRLAGFDLGFLPGQDTRGIRPVGFECTRLHYRSASVACEGGDG